MRVVQIAGPSYSGSTVVGYILNATSGWFFGSEVYRLLPAFIDEKGSKTSRCVACAGDCPYWSEPLKAGLARHDGATLADLYDAFSRRHPDVESFVDGSKGTRWFAGAWSSAQVVPAKHPMRMVASYLYNQNGQLGFARNPTFAEFRQRAAERDEDVLSAASRALQAILLDYDRVLDDAPNAILCRSDTLHVDAFAEFRRLCAHLGISADVATVLQFSAHEVHPVGGNQAPLWQRQESEGVVNERARADARRLYYAAQSHGELGDYRIDNKFQELLPDDVTDKITELPRYRRLCDVLGYQPAAPSTGAV